MRNKNYDNGRSFIIQRKITIFILIVIGIAISRNIIENISLNEKIFNIVTLSILGVFFIPCYFLNHQRIRFTQVSIIILVGILSSLFEKNIQGTGNIVLILGCLLLYRYRILKKSKWWHGVILFSILLTLNSVIVVTQEPQPIVKNFIFTSGEWNSLFLARSIVFSSVNVFLLFAAISIYKDDIDKYNEVAERYDSYTRVGQKAATLLRDMDCRPIAEIVEDIVPSELLKKYREVDQALWRLRELVLFRDEMRKEVLDSIEMSRPAEARVMDICYAIEAFFSFQYEFSRMDKRIEFVLTPRTGIYVKVITSDLYGLFCNIFDPIVRMLMKEKNRNSLSIICTTTKNEVHIAIFTTGPGMKKFPPKKDPVIDTSFYLSRSEEYFQFADARDMAYAMNGDIDFKNREEGGLDIFLKLPRTDERCLSEEEFIEEYNRYD